MAAALSASTDAELAKVFKDFTGKIKKGTTAVFYLSGYGMHGARQSHQVPGNAPGWARRGYWWILSEFRSSTRG